MTRGATPTHTFTLPIEISSIKNFIISYAQNGKIVLNKTMSECEIEGDKIKVSLTQEETLSFSHNIKAEIQIKFLTIEDKLIPTKIFETRVSRIINEEVLK